MKKVLLFFAIMMMAVTSSYAKVYEIDCTQNKDVNLMEPGESVTINGVVITSLNGVLRYQREDGGYWDWWGDAKENSFQISTEKGETITHIEITGEVLLLDGTEWTKTATGVTWTGSALSVNFGRGFQSTKLTVTVDETTAHTHNYADAWSKDETNHWHACTGEGECDAPKSGEAAHSYGEVATETAYYTCSVCQYENATRKAEYEVATLNIALNSSGYATFSCKSNVNVYGAEAYEASVDGETITLTKLTGYIPAGTGVILYSEDPNATVTLSVATSGDAAADVSTNNDLKATTKADGSLATLEANSWALGDNQEFLHFTGDAYIPKRAYLVHEKPAGAKAMRMVFAEGEATGIDATMIDTATREGKFIDGSKIVIIKNGTKYNVAGQVIK